MINHNLHTAMRILPSLFVAFACVNASAQLPRPEPPRAWKTAEGAPFTATLLGFDGATATFKMPNGQAARAPLDKLSAEDQAFLAEWQKRQPIKVVLPEVAGVDPAALKIEIVGEDAAAEKFVYRTPHFEFESQGKFNTALLREVARNFEATYELVKALPWGILPEPENGAHFKARLLKDKAAYFAAGGPPNSSGVYKRGEALFMVPFESIGVKVLGKSYAKDDDFDYSTLVHELTHQMMHASLPLLPQWVIEGCAEYTSNLPLKTGRFRVSAAKNGLKDYLDFLKKRALHGVPEPYPLDQLFGVSNQQWNSILAQDPLSSRRLYFTSYLLVYYFMHLDGAGDGQRFARFFREVGEPRRVVQEWRKAMEEFKKQPGVEILADGGFRYPGNLTPPPRPAVLESPDEDQRKLLALLLDDRSEAELMKQIRSAYAKLGIRL
jgi:hypothetical protein